MATLKINSQVKNIVDDIERIAITDINFIESVHPEIIKLLFNAKSNDKFLSDKAYRNQNKINFDCVTKAKNQSCILIDKKAS
jgi:hypothetical protein